MVSATPFLATHRTRLYSQPDVAQTSPDFGAENFLSVKDKHP